jgi:hypothetical protein
MHIKAVMVTDVLVNAENGKFFKKYTSIISLSFNLYDPAKNDEIKIKCSILNSYRYEAHYNLMYLKEKCLTVSKPKKCSPFADFFIK